MRSSTSRTTAARGGRCRWTSRRVPRCSGSSAGGVSTACGTGFTTYCATECGPGRDAGPSQLPRSSIRSRCGPPRPSERKAAAGTAARRKKVGGRKRHVAVDVLGLLLLVHVTGANVQDRDAAFFLLQRMHLLYRKITLVWADSGYDYGRLIEGALKILRVSVQIVRRTDDMTGFVILPRRWIVERTLSWICQRRRCVRDYERRTDNHEAMVTISMIMLMNRRLARPLPRTA
ncbi:MAG TPA: transposase [Actinocrinis sp.]|uniref:transposase n=1 Tax=Actinocrinis sp. TaxID=1920516 RepID=UPI002DDD0035|nr:transposase [Actinocrinis sp.]HEV2346491.1 transposase [Actinocrinis sp.]